MKMNDLKRIEDKIDQLVEGQHEQNTQLKLLNFEMNRNTDSLIIHEKRTDLSEQRIQKIENTHTFIRGALWVIGTLFVAIQVYFKLR